MKNHPLVKKAIESDYEVFASPVVVAEFSHNRYSGAVANNVPDDADDAENPDVFSIDSIIEPNRPSKGVVKARIGSALVRRKYAPTPPTSRFVLSTPEDQYKYWSSPYPTASSATSGVYKFPAGTAGMPTDVNPYVTYSKAARSNKIVVGFENSLNTPTEFTVHVKTSASGSWTQIANQSTTTLSSHGRFTIYYNGSTWAGTKTLSSAVNLYGVQLRVASMNKPGAYLELIELGAFLEVDITDNVTSFNSDFEMGDVNSLLPIGRISSNSANIGIYNSLVNDANESSGLMFDENNVNSPFYGLMNENVKFTISYEYDVSSYGEFNPVVVQDSVMFADSAWSIGVDEEGSISTKDASKFLQETKCPELFYITDGLMTVGQIIWKLLDTIGFSRYKVDATDTAAPVPMNFVWSQNDEYVWDFLNRLAEATQTALYFDAYGILQIKTRNAAYNNSASPQWVFRARSSGDYLEDVVSLRNEEKDVSNYYRIMYRPTDFERTSNDNIIKQIAWEPESSEVVLRSTDLVNSITATSTSLVIPSVEATDWPFSGMLQMNGEVMRFEGKDYKYIDDTAGGVTKTERVNNFAEYQARLFKTNTNKQYLNAFTGKIYLTERGVWNTYPAAHSTNPQNYVITSTRGASAFSTLYGYYYKKRKVPARKQSNKTTGYNPSSASSITLSSSTTWDTSQYLYAKQTGGGLNGLAPGFYGTRLRIPTTSKMRDNFGGLFFSASGTNVSAVNVELRPTSSTNATTKEVLVYVKGTDGQTVRVNGQGWRANVVKGKWYTLDVQFSRGSGTGPGNTNHYVWVWLDGRLLGKATISGSVRRQNSDSFGMFLRGRSSMEYEYLYAFSRQNVSEIDPYTDENTSYYDRVFGGWVARQGSATIDTYKTRSATRRVKKKNQKFTQRYDVKYFDDFGSVIHEMKEFNVNFADKLPGTYPTLVATQEASAKYLDFRGTPFGAKFYAVNAGHNDVNIHGTIDDVDQRLAVVTQQIVQKDADEVIVENKASQRALGRKEYEMTSDFIQTEAQAKDIGEWIKSHWDENTDEVTVEVFGNPLLELTDVVALDDPDSGRFMVKYFVTNIAQEFSEGLETTVRLRKVKV